MKKSGMALIFLFGFLILSGCSTTQSEPETQYITKEVKVPARKNIPKPPELNFPSLPIEDLKKKSSFKEIAESYVISVELLKEEVIYRGMLLDAYRIEEK